jgi:hypothetical protein
MGPQQQTTNAPRAVRGPIGRNDLCPCGSGLKYKRCCANKRDRMPLGSRIALALVVAVLLGGLIFFLASLDEFAAPSAGPQRVWSEEHQHWH